MWENLFHRMLTTVVQIGQLTINYPSGRSESYGNGTGDPVAIRIHDHQALRLLLKNPELHLGEVYMDGRLTVEGDDLRGFMAVLLKNVGRGNYSGWQKLLNRYRTFKKRVVQHNPIGKAQRNVAHHYDLSGQLYDLFLDTDKQYSCAYFRSPEDTLEQAQAQKKAHIARKLRIEPGMRVLDIGCGWGGMGLTLARDFGAKVIGVTLSEEQHKIAQARAEAAGLADKCEFRLQDYRHVPESFDRIVSVGMFEHVGVPHYHEYFGFIHKALAEDGLALIHTIAHTGPPGHMDPWMQRYIFPGAYAPALSEVAQAMEQFHFCVADIEVLRVHYADTLLHWWDRFTANADRARDIYDDRFVQMWRFYLASMEASFRHGRLLVHQYQISKTNVAAPITRDYLYRDDTTAAPAAVSPLTG